MSEEQVNSRSDIFFSILKEWGNKEKIIPLIQKMSKLENGIIILGCLTPFVLVWYYSLLSIFSTMVIKWWANKQEKARKDRLIKRVSIIDYYTPRFIDNLESDLQKDFDNEMLDSNIEIYKFFDKDSITRGQRTFSFKENDWNRYSVVNTLKISSPDLIIMECPSTLAFYYGYIKFHKNNVIVSSVISQIKRIHIKTTIYTIDDVSLNILM